MIHDVNKNERWLINNLNNPLTCIICVLIIKRVFGCTYILQINIKGMHNTWSPKYTKMFSFNNRSNKLHNRCIINMI